MDHKVVEVGFKRATKNGASGDKHPHTKRKTKLKRAKVKKAVGRINAVIETLGRILRDLEAPLR